MPATLVEHGHEIAGPDARKSDSADPGSHYFATDTGVFYVRTTSGWLALVSAGGVDDANGSEELNADSPTLDADSAEGADNGE